MPNGSGDSYMCGGNSLLFHLLTSENSGISKMILFKLTCMITAVRRTVLKIVLLFPIWKLLMMSF